MLAIKVQLVTFDPVWQGIALEFELNKYDFSLLV